MKKLSFIACCVVFFIHSLKAQTPLLLEALPEKEAPSEKRSFTLEDVITIHTAEPLPEQHNIKLVAHGHQWYSLLYSDYIQHQSEWKILQAGFLKPEIKISNEFRDYPDIQSQLASGRPVLSDVWFLGNRGEIRKFCSASELENVQFHPSLNKFRVVLGQNQITFLSKQRAITFISPVLEQRSLLGSTATSMSRMNLVNENAPLGLGLRGNGVGVGVWDFGAAGVHYDFEKNLVAVENEYFNASGSQHTSQVTGIIGGTGVLSPSIVGSAPEAKVYVHNYFGDIFQEMKDLYTNHHVIVTNHSYNIGGNFQCGVLYQYSSGTVEMEQFALENPQMVTVLAAGNSAVGCPYDFGNIVPGFQYAKNVLLVGNLQNNQTLYPGSAQGPTSDGRLAPHIVAKGASSFVNPNAGLVTTGAANNYVGSFGTSFSAPQVAATVALMQEAAIKNALQEPDALTAKAILCNSAKDLGNFGPDYSYGFGRLHAYDAITDFLQQKFAKAEITADSTWTMNVEVPAGMALFKVFLGWNDPLVQLPVSKILLNDLDIEVIAPDGTHQALVLDPLNPGSAAVEGKDSINNTEQVVIKNPQPGTYTILVKAAALTESSQKFVVAYHWDTAGVKITWPLEKTVVAGNAPLFIRWDAELQQDSIIGEYSLDGGLTWVAIDTVSGSDDFMAWTTPNVSSDSALVRLKINGEIKATMDNFFYLFPRPVISSNRNCHDAITLNWAAITGLNTFEVLQYLENGTWKLLATVNANTFTFRNPERGKEYIFAVQGIKNGIQGARSIAFRVTNRESNCTFINRDAGIAAILPEDGRIGDTHALSNQQKITILVRNYSSSVTNGAKLSYEVNGVLVRDTLLSAILANDTLEYISPETFDFSSEGIYSIKAWVTTPGDTIISNDTLVKNVRQYAAQAAFSLPYLEDFESGKIFEVNPKNVIAGNEEWSFYNNKNGRVKTSDFAPFALGGQQSILIDNHRDADTAINQLILQLNLQNYTDSLVYMDFKFRRHNDAFADDSLLIRGNSTDNWVNAVNLFAAAPLTGFMNEVKYLNISELLKKNQQSFSNQTQWNFKTGNLRAIASVTANGGYSLDDIHIYNPGKDLSLVEAFFDKNTCLGQNDSLLFAPSLKVKNNFTDTLYGFSADYIINDSIIVTEDFEVEMLPFSEVTVTFSKETILKEKALYRWKAFIRGEGDDFPINDSVFNKDLVILPILNVDSYIQKNINGTYDWVADGSDAQWITGGINSSWEFGFQDKTASPLASVDTGNYWTTGLLKNYNDNEYSYLYTGCIENQSLKNKGIAFQHWQKTEKDADFLTIQYALEQKNWFTIGDTETGVNWFNANNSLNFWDGNTQGWKAASHPLPEFPYLYPYVSFRWLFQSDDYINDEGIAIDDVYFYTISNDSLFTNEVIDYQLKLSGDTTTFLNAQNRPPVFIYTNQYNAYQNLKWLVGDEIGQVKNHYILPDRYIVETDTSLGDSVLYSLWISKNKLASLSTVDTTIKSIKDIGVILYRDMNIDTLLENNHFSKNYEFIPADNVKILPERNGYRALFKTLPGSAEIYFSSISGNVSQPDFFVSAFSVQKSTDSTANRAITFTIDYDIALDSVMIEYAVNDFNFNVLDTLVFDGTFSTPQNFALLDTLAAQEGITYYRLKYLSNGNISYSLLDSITTELPTRISHNLLKNNYQLVYDETLGLKLKSANQSSATSTLRVLNISGQLMEEITLPIQQGWQHLPFSQLEFLPAGTYFLWVNDGKQSWTGKFVHRE